MKRRRFANPYTYTGRRLDPETGLYRNRYYDAQLGRFISRDPIGYEGSPWNLYEYVDGNPVRYRDPSGKQFPIPIDVEGAHVNCKMSMRNHMACVCGGFPCWKIFGLTGRAEAAETEAGRFANEHAPASEDDQNPVRNQALRHCMALALLARSDGARCAICLGRERERWQMKCRDQEPTDTKRALANNDYGAKTCSKSDDPGACCLQALENGDLERR